MINLLIWCIFFSSIVQKTKFFDAQAFFMVQLSHPYICGCSVAWSCLTICDPMDCSTPGFPVLHHTPELAQIHVQWVSDAIQPSYPLSSPSPPAFNLSKHQGLFQWVSSSHQVAKYWSFKALCSLLSHYIYHPPRVRVCMPTFRLWGTGRPDMLQSTGSQRARLDCVNNTNPIQAPSPA